MIYERSPDNLKHVIPLLNFDIFYCEMIVSLESEKLQIARDGFRQMNF